MTSDDVMAEFETFLSTQDDLREKAVTHLLALAERIQYLAMEEGKEKGILLATDSYDGEW